MSKKNRRSSKKTRSKREQRAKKKGNSYIFIILAVLVIGIVIAYYLSSFRGRSSRAHDAIPEDREIAAKTLSNPFKVDDIFLEKGEEIYDRFCMTCHGPDGRLPRSHPFSIHAGHHTPGDYVWIATYGIPEKGMPAWKDKLTYKERWQVITYIQKTFSNTEPMMMR